MSAGGRWSIFTVLLTAFLLLAGSVSATIRESEFMVRVAERPTNIIPGKPIDLEFIISAAVQSEFQDVSLSGKGWQVAAHRGLKSVGLATGGETSLSFTVTPDGTWEPMTLEFIVNGVTHKKTVDLSPWEVRQARFGGSLEPPGKTSFMERGYGRIEDPPGSKPGPMPLEKFPPELFGEPGLPLDTGSKSAATWNTSGRIGYYYLGSFRPVFGVTVTLCHYTGLILVPLESTTTNRDGSFSISFSSCAPGIVLKLIASASNAAMAVMVDSYIWEDVYHWKSEAVVCDGSDIDWGDQVIDKHFGAAEIVNATSRANTFLCANANLSGLPKVDIWWPADTDESYYDRESVINWTPDIYINNSKTWENKTHIHEYGHHFLVTQAESPRGDYCNDGAWCDDNPALWDCSHCSWCPENASVALTEGFPNWVADIVCRKWYAEPGRSPMGAKYYETILTCKDGVVDTGNYGRTGITEGVFAALLRDIEDNDYDNDPRNLEFDDVLTVPIPYILRTFMHEEPSDPWQFIVNFRDRYPQYDRLLWEVCGNNGYEGHDDSAPYGGSISSPSHPRNVSSPAARVLVAISGFEDDFSGIAGYNLQINEGSPLTPGTEITHKGLWGEFEMDPQPPGEYYLSIRSIDRAENVSTGWTSYGPIIIREAEPCDLAPDTWTPDWDYPVMPKRVPVFDGTVIHAETNEIIGDTYWNACVVNTGEENSPNQRAAIKLDDVEIAHYYGFVNGFGEHLPAYNQGPLTIPGGRHTFGLSADFNQVAAETDETNNDWAKQWIWYPPFMLAGNTYSSDAAPMRTAGWDAIPGTNKWYNCNGYRVLPQAGSAPSTWVAVWAKAPNTSDDVDIRMHTMAASATEGFGPNIAASYRPPGFLDAVLVNTDVSTDLIYDIGVMTAPSQLEPSQYRTAASFGHALEDGVSFATTLATNEGLDLYTFRAEPGIWYLATIELDEMDMNGPIKLSHFGPDFGSGHLLEHGAMLTTDQDKRGTLLVIANHSSPATHAFAVWRDQVETIHNAQSYTIRVREWPTDLVPDRPEEWAGPIVPRRDDDATDTWAPEPTLLSGEVSLTWLNYAFSNVSRTESPGVAARLDLDGTQVYLNDHPALAAGEMTTFRSGSPVRVRGGRHVLSLTVDPADLVSEGYEANNATAVQYVWKPTLLNFYSVANRADPPPRTADWDLLSASGNTWYNCDARRTATWYPSGDSDHWGAIAALPGPATDVDLRLHDKSTGPRDGFTSALATSSWSLGQSELLVMNFRNSEIRSFDIGVVEGGYTSGEGYRITVVKSVGLGADPDGVLWNGLMSSNELVQLYEIEFTRYGLYHATLSVANPDLDLGFSLYGPDLVHGGKSSVKEGTAAGWLETGGTDDTFDFYVLPGDTGFHGLAIWKVGANDVSGSSEYTLTIELDDLSPVFPEDTPLATRLLGAYPNPFNPQTTIAFELDWPTTTGLKIYDISGRMVCTVVEAQLLEAGKHEVVWQGRDGSGRQLGSGVYFYRLEAGPYIETKRMVLVK